MVQIKKWGYGFFVIIYLLGGLFSHSIMAQAAEEEPTSVIISYKVAPENRVAFRSYMKEQGLAQFSAWKASGTISDYTILSGMFNNENRWDMMIIVDFDQFSMVGNWQNIEQEYPGGLNEEGLKLATPIETDMVGIFRARHSNSSDSNMSSVFLVIPYTFHSTGVYKKYVDEYVMPQTDGWINNGILKSYQLFINRHHSSVPWDSLLILEYRDMKAFGQRGRVKTEVRAMLSKNKTWAAAAKTKFDIRRKLPPVTAEKIN